LIHLILDTSVFRQDRSRQSTASKALTKLLQSHKVTLHVPEWVKREVLSQLEEDAHAKLAALSNCAKALNDLSYLGEILAFSQDLLSRIAQLEDLVRGCHGKTFKEWLLACNAVEHPTQPEHAARLTEAYFIGEAPFSKAKSRTDIPDAFIWQSILDILKMHESLHLVVADKRFRTYAESVNGIFVYEGLAQFIQTEACQAALKVLDEKNVAENSLRVSTLLEEDTAEWVDLVRDRTELALKDRSFRDNDVPTSNHEALILSAGDSEFQFRFDLAEYYGVGEIEIPFTVSAQCKIQYTLQVAIYEQLPTRRVEGMEILELNPLAYLVEEHAILLIDAMLNVKLKEDKLTQSDLSDAELLALAAAAEMKIQISDTTILDLL
jgi:hypothetical protein